jgi:DNA-binding IclR family transcriptional regulator
MDETGWAVAAVGIAGPAQRLTEDRIKACLPYLLRAAQAISEKLGARAEPVTAG